MASRATSPAGAAQDVPTYAGGAEGQIGPPMPPGMSGAVPTPVIATGLPGAGGIRRRALAQRLRLPSLSTRQPQLPQERQAWGCRRAQRRRKQQQAPQQRGSARQAHRPHRYKSKTHGREAWQLKQRLTTVQVWHSCLK